ncbi:MAG: transcription elongation factor GreA [Chloroflexi bacterium]|nr:transcription elongation factor GreA [Chloroflexota bacterium]
MVQKEAYLTERGLRKLQEELEHLVTVRRKEVAEQIQRAKEIGGTVDNAEYDDAKNEQARIEGRILALEELVKEAKIIPSTKTPSESVQVGSTVVLKDTRGKKLKFTIVGSTETDPPKGRISNESPVGRALLGKKRGDIAEAKTPSGVVQLQVIDIL